MATTAKKALKKKKGAATKKAARKPAKKRAATKKATRKPAKKRAATKKATRKPAKKRAATKKATRKPAKKRATTKKATRKPVKKRTATKKATRKPVKKRAATKKATRKPAKKRTATKKATRKPVKKRTATKKATRRPARRARPKRPKSYLTRKDKKQLRDKLLERKKNLIEEINRTVDYMQVESNHFADPGDRATHEEERNLELKERDRERKLIRKIDLVLEQVSAPDYGYCVLCGAEIGLKRLEARPTAMLCVDCKTLEELKERQATGRTP